MARLNSKWTGPGCILMGLFLLAGQVYAYLDAGLISARLIGGGIGCLMIGAAAWFYYLEDRWPAEQTAADEELPTADEYERYYEEIDSEGADPGGPASPGG